MTATKSSSQCAVRAATMACLSTKNRYSEPTDTPARAGTAMAIYGAASTLWTLLVVSLRQAIVPDRLMGRVTSGFRLSAMGATPPGALGGGVPAHAAGLRAPFLAGTVAIALALVVAAWRLPGAVFPRTADPVPAISGQ